MGGEAGARLASESGLRINPDTMLRCMVRATDTRDGPVRVLGIGDWYSRRMLHSGTILVDLERHRVVGVLPDREVESVVGRLQQHPEVKPWTDGIPKRDAEIESLVELPVLLADGVAGTKVRTPGVDIRLVATDLDGTLLRGDGTVSERTRRCLERVREAGVTLVLVTARPPRTLRRMADDLGLTGLAVCCNGAIIYNLERDEIVDHSPLRSEVAADIVAALRDAAPGVRFALELGARWGWEPGYAELNPAVRQPGGLEGDAVDLCAMGPVTKLIARHGVLSTESLLEVARGLVGDAAHATHSGAPFVEISAAGVHKALALRSLCGRLGVGASEVVAFGDMPNDLPMLEWAELGVAVANAHPEVLAAADEVTPSNEEDGVAVALDRLVAAGEAGPRHRDAHTSDIVARVEGSGGD